jgi:hypothetical protein
MPWFKSSYSAGNGACVEVAFVPEAWRQFVDDLRDGTLERS